MQIDALTVFIASAITALATGLGAVPFFFTRNPGDRWLGFGDAGAAGLMVGASVGLVYEGRSYGQWQLGLGIVVGALFVIISSRLLQGNDHSSQLGDEEQRSFARMVLIIGVMTVHSFAEGMGVGVSYGGGEELGLFVTIAIAIHNIPEGFAISLTMVPRGKSPWSAAAWSVFSSLPQPLVAVPAYLFVRQFSSLLPFGFGFAAGAMVWVAVVSMLPGAFERISSRSAWVTFAGMAAVMGGTQIAFS